MTMALPPQYELKRDGDRFFILARNTGWESQRFGLENIEVLKSGMTQSLQVVFNLRVMLK